MPPKGFIGTIVDCFEKPKEQATRMEDFARDVFYGHYENAVQGVQNFRNLTTAQEVQAIILLDIARSLRRL